MSPLSATRFVNGSWDSHVDGFRDSLTVTGLGKQVDTEVELQFDDDQLITACCREVTVLYLRSYGKSLCFEKASYRAVKIDFFTPGSRSRGHVRTVCARTLSASCSMHFRSRRSSTIDSAFGSETTARFRSRCSGQRL